MTFWAISNNHVKSVWLLLGHFGGKLGNFFHHLVTLQADWALSYEDNLHSKFIPTRAGCKHSTWCFEFLTNSSGFNHEPMS